MSTSIQELIADAKRNGNWDAVADWCEAFDWAEAVGMPATEFYLECAAAVRPANESQLLETISAARASGTSWERIGEILGLSAQDAEDCYNPLLETQDIASARP